MDKPLEHLQDTQPQRVHGEILIMSTVGLWAGGYAEDKGTASHLPGDESPMFHRCLMCDVSEKQAVKDKTNIILYIINL